MDTYIFTKTSWSYFLGVTLVLSWPGDTPVQAGGTPGWDWGTPGQDSGTPPSTGTGVPIGKDMGPETRVPPRKGHGTRDWEGPGIGDWGIPHPC